MTWNLQPALAMISFLCSTPVSDSHLTCCLSVCGHLSLFRCCYCFLVVDMKQRLRCVIVSVAHRDWNWNWNWLKESTALQWRLCFFLIRRKRNTFHLSHVFCYYSCYAVDSLGFSVFFIVVLINVSSFYSFSCVFYSICVVSMSSPCQRLQDF